MPCIFTHECVISGITFFLCLIDIYSTTQTRGNINKRRKYNPNMEYLTTHVVIIILCKSYVYKQTEVQGHHANKTFFLFHEFMNKFFVIKVHLLHAFVLKVSAS